MKLIDADRLIKELDKMSETERKEWKTSGSEASLGASVAYECAICIADYMQSMKPEIVHCKDCVSMEYDNLFNQCWCNGREVSMDFYCAKGERKTNGTTTT